MLGMETYLKLTGFSEPVRGEPSFLLQIQWKDTHLAMPQWTSPDMIPVMPVPDDPVYSYFHRIPYSSFSNFPPSELDLSRYFSAADFSAQCSLYLAPKMASFISDIVYSLRGIFPPSLLIFAQLQTLNMNFSFAPGCSHQIYPPTEQLIPRRQDPHHQPQGAPLRSREFLNNTLSRNSMEGYEMRGAYLSERNGSGARGACLPAIARLKEPKLGREDSETGDCSVCLQEMSAIEELLAMPCDHIFHKKCILSWLESKKSCPLCRSQL